MIPGAAIAAGVQGLTSIAGGIIGSGKRKREQRDILVDVSFSTTTKRHYQITG